MLTLDWGWGGGGGGRWADSWNLIEIHLPREIWSETKDVVDLNLQANGAAKNCWKVVLTLANDVLFNDLHGAEFVWASE